MSAALNDQFKAHKVCVVVPTYNNATTLSSVLDGLLNYTDRIVVVNDGSTDDTADILKRYPQILSAGYAQNKGKGFALRTAFNVALKSGYEYAITIDSDGQHYADDLTVFIDALEANRNAVIIGSRNMDQATVPGKSNFGNKFSSFWFWVNTGIKRNDTQSGYRLYPLLPLSRLKFVTNKYEFEIEVIVRAAWAGVDVIEIPVKVFYPEKEKRISHFRPFKDFSRISVLNTVLVTIAFLFIKPRDLFRSIKKKNFGQLLKDLFTSPGESDRTKAISVAVGIFTGVAPIWGFQLITAIALSIFFRLNKTLVIIAANISIPPMIPLIIYLSHLTGRIWMGKDAQTIGFSEDITLAFIHKNALQYFAGAITLSVIAAFTLGFVTFVVLKLFKKRQAA